MGQVYAFLLIYSILMVPGGWLIDHLGTRDDGGHGCGLGILGVMTGVLGWFGLAVSALYVPFLLVGCGGATCVPLHRRRGACRSGFRWPDDQLQTD